MKIKDLSNAPQWLLDARVENENVGIEKGQVIWRGGTWHDGTWWGRKVKSIILMPGLYRYYVAAYITTDNEHRITMGCHDRSLAEWEADEWNNPSEFPNDGSEKSRRRHFALETAKAWLKEFG